MLAELARVFQAGGGQDAPGPGVARAMLGTSAGGQTMKLIGIGATALVLVAAAAGAARADEARIEKDVAEVGRGRVAAPHGAFEVGVDTGYTQGFGGLSAGRSLGDAAGAGLGVGLTLGARLTPAWSLGVSGQYQAYGAGSLLGPGTSVRGGAADVGVTLHTMPYDRVDPWVSLGAGYRVFAESPAGSAPPTLTHGPELAKLQLGLDIRATDSVAIAPVLGADLSMFAWRSGGGAETAPLTTRPLSTFVFAGIQGRFDIGGRREAPIVVEQVGER